MLIINIYRSFRKLVINIKNKLITSIVRESVAVAFALSSFACASNYQPQLSDYAYCIETDRQQECYIVKPDEMVRYTDRDFKTETVVDNPDLQMAIVNHYKIVLTHQQSYIELGNLSDAVLEYMDQLQYPIDRDEYLITCSDDAFSMAHGCPW